MKIYRAQETADGGRQTMITTETQEQPKEWAREGTKKVGEGGGQVWTEGQDPGTQDEQRREHKPCLPGVPSVDLSQQEAVFCLTPSILLPSPPDAAPNLNPPAPRPPLPLSRPPFSRSPAGTSAVRRLGPTHNGRHTAATSLTFSCIENFARNGEEQLTQFLSICPVLRRNSTHWHVLSFDSTRPPTAIRQILSRRNTIARLPRWCAILAHCLHSGCLSTPRQTRQTRGPSSHQKDSG